MFPGWWDCTRKPLVGLLRVGHVERVGFCMRLPERVADAHAVDGQRLPRKAPQLPRGVQPSPNRARAIGLELLHVHL